MDRLSPRKQTWWSPGGSVNEGGSRSQKLRDVVYDIRTRRREEEKTMSLITPVVLYP